MSRRRRVGLLQEFCKPTCHAALSNDADFGSVVELQSADCDPAKVMRLLEDCRVHRRQIAGRRIDDLQYFGSRGLLLQGLTRLGYQARVLDRNDGLVGKGAHQLDLPLGKRLNPLAPESDDTD